MKYFIGHLIEGEAALWHNALAKNIAEKFNIWKIYEVCPPHITIFYEFETENIEQATHFLKDWTDRISGSGKISISDFGHFDDRAVFAKAEVDPTIKETVRELRMCLEKIPNMPKERFPVWQPHATLAFRLSPEEITKIWEYVQTLEKPNFTIPFNNVTIFRFEDEKCWVVEKTFKIQ